MRLQRRNNVRNFNTDLSNLCQKMKEFWNNKHASYYKFTSRSIFIHLAQAVLTTRLIPCCRLTEKKGCLLEIHVFPLLVTKTGLRIWIIGKLAFVSVSFRLSCWPFVTNFYLVVCVESEPSCFILFPLWQRIQEPRTTLLSLPQSVTTRKSLFSGVSYISP